MAITSSGRLNGSSLSGTLSATISDRSTSGFNLNLTHILTMGSSAWTDPNYEIFTAYVSVSGTGITSKTITFDVKPLATGLYQGESLTTTKTSWITATATATSVKISFYIYGNILGDQTSTSSIETKTFSAAQYTITFNANGGSGASSAKTVTAGGSITLPAAPTTFKPTSWSEKNYFTITGVGGNITVTYTEAYSQIKTSYSFGGWATSSSATSGSAVGTSYEPTENVTLYAVWVPNQETSYYNNTLSNLIKPNKSSTTGSEIIITVYTDYENEIYQTFTSTNTITYLFSHWEDSSGNTLVDSTSFYDNSTVYAIFNENIGTYNNIILPSPEKTNYVFNGYSTTPEGTGTIPAGTFIPTASITLYAIYVPTNMVKCRLRYIGNQKINKIYLGNNLITAIYIQRNNETVAGRSGTLGIDFALGEVYLGE